MDGVGVFWGEGRVDGLICAGLVAWAGIMGCGVPCVECCHAAIGDVLCGGVVNALYEL